MRRTTLALFLILTATPVLASPWSIALELALSESVKTLAVDGTKQLVELFVGKLNDWLSKERGAGPGAIQGGSISQVDGHEVRTWSITGTELTNDQILELANFMQRIDGGRTQQLGLDNKGTSQDQVVINSTGTIQITGDGNKARVTISNSK